MFDRSVGRGSERSFYLVHMYGYLFLSECFKNDTIKLGGSHNQQAFCKEAAHAAARKTPRREDKEAGRGF